MRAHLTTTSPEVWERTERALADTETITDPLQVRCRACGKMLARMADTPHGPLFTSSWEVPVKSPVRVVVDGEELRPRAQRRHEEKHEEVISESGPPVGRPEVHGTIGLLALPQQFPQDFPDFMVRCQKHGDRVLDRLELLKSLRAGKGIRVDLDGGRIEYVLRHPGGGADRVLSRRTTRQRRGRSE